MKRIQIIPLLAVLVSSCFADNVSVRGIKLLRTDEDFSIEADTTQSSLLTVVDAPTDLQIVDDTLLVIQEKATSGGDFYKVFSLNTLEYLGHFATKGRGPGELLSPCISKSSSEDKYLCLRDNYSHLACRIDVTASIESGRIVPVSADTLSGNIIDWIPISDGESIEMEFGNDGYVLSYDSVNNNGIHKQFNFYQGLNSISNATALSYVIAANGNCRKAVLAMLFLPQIMLIDFDNGDVKYVAVEKTYRNWRRIANSPLNANTIQYYSGISATSRYIFASYRNVSLDTMLNGGSGSYIHIFDWSGRFLRQYKTKEDISALAFDENSNMLYCVDRTDNGIVRYICKGL